MIYPIDPRTRDRLASRFRAGDSVANLADDYGISPEQVEAALRGVLFPPAQPAPTTGDGRDVILDLVQKMQSPRLWRYTEGPIVDLACLLEDLCGDSGPRWDEILLSRREVGIATYGVPLQPHNSRDARRDAIEEVADALIYLWQERMEQEVPK